MDKFLIDSDVMIWFLRGKKSAADLFYKIKRLGISFCSPVSIVEVLSGVKPSEEDVTENFLNFFDVIPVDREIAQAAGWLINKHKKEGALISVSDAIIAVTCVENDLVLVTYNKKHYQALGVKMQVL